MADYLFRNSPLPGSNIRNIAGVNYDESANVLAIIGTIGVDATVEQLGAIAVNATAGEYDVTTVGAATSFVFEFASSGQSLVPIP